MINSRKCIEIAEHIRISGGVPEDKEDPMPYSFPPLIAHNAWCAVVAICHQTTPVVGTALCGSVNGVILRGWDYLLQKSIFETNRDPMLFTVEWLCAATAQTLQQLYRDTEDLDTLNYPEERAMLLADLGDFLKRNHWQNIHEAYLASDGYIIKSDGLGIAQVFT